MPFCGRFRRLVPGIYAHKRKDGSSLVENLVTGRPPLVVAFALFLLFAALMPGSACARLDQRFLSQIGHSFATA